MTRLFATGILIASTLGFSAESNSGKPTPLHIWVEGPDQYAPGPEGRKNPWPFVSLAELERRLPVRFDLFYVLSAEEFLRASRYDFDVDGEKAYFAKLKKASAQWLLTEANAALVMGTGPQTGSEDLIRRYLKQGGTVIWTADPKKEFADILPVEFEAKPDSKSSQRVLGTDRLFDGVPLDKLSVAGLPAFNAKLASSDEVLMHTEQERPLVVLAQRGGGKVLFAPGLLPIPRAEWEAWEKTDTESIWVMVWDRLFARLRGDGKPAIARLEPKPNADPHQIEIALSAPDGKYGYQVGEAIEIAARLTNSSERTFPDASFVAAWQDVEGRTHHVEKRKISLPARGEMSEKITWTMPDLGTEGWFFWLIAECRSADRPLGRTVMPVHRFKRYSLHEQWQWSAWTNLRRFPQLAAPSVLQLFQDAGYNALGHDSGEADWPWCYRWGMRQYVEIPHFAGIDNIGWPEDSLDAFLRQRAPGTWPRVVRSSVPALASYGEEPGFGGAFGTTWHWGDGPANEGANHWYRTYLRELYGNSIEKLNAQWETSFASFDAIQLDKEYGGTGHRGREELKRMGPIKPTMNLSRYVDSHAFYHWYLHRFNQQLVKTFGSMNPTTVSVMSMDNEFMTQLEQVGMYVHWLYPKEWMQSYVAYQRQFAADPAGFIMNWGFFDDERINNQVYLLSLMQGANAFSFWYDFGLQFNPDLTHTRASLQFRALRQQLEPKQGVVIHPLPKVDNAIGIYIPTLDWKASLGRPAWMLGMREEGKIAPWMAGYGGFEQTIYSAICENGYAPRYVGRDKFASCKIIFLPYAQAIPAADADALRQFVRDGGVVMATPKLATHDIHGKPFAQVPGEGMNDLFGFTAEPILRNTYQFVATWPVSNWAADAKIRFAEGMRLPGGDPLRLQSFGYQPILQTDAQTKIEATYPDGSPAILIKSHGKGSAIFLNVNYFWSEEWYTQFSRHRESFRIFINEVLKFAGVEPASYFLEMNYQTGIHEPRVGVYPFATSDGSLTYLRMFCDWRSTPVTALLKLRDPVQRVVDVMTGEELARVDQGAGGRYAVPMKPAQGRILAMLTEQLSRIDLKVPSRSVSAGKTLPLTIALRDKDGKPIHQTRPVQVRVTDLQGKPIRILQRDVEVSGEIEVPLSLAISDFGKYKITVQEGCEDVMASIEMDVRTSAVRNELPATVENFRPHAAAQLCGTDAIEFIALLERIRQVYLNSNGDKVLLSAHLQSRPDGRHAACAQLGLVDWSTMENALMQSLQKGSLFILGAEDIGFEPRTGRPLQPWGPQTQMTVISKLVARGDARLLQHPELPDFLVLALGKGYLILHRRSPDSAGATPADFADWHARFVADLRRVGIQGASRFDAANLKPASPEIRRDLKSWFMREY